MREMAFLSEEGLAYSPGDNGDFEPVGEGVVPDGAVLVVQNSSRPGYYPMVGDVLLVRHRATNEIVALDDRGLEAGAVPRMFRTGHQIDHRLERIDARVRVVSLRRVGDGVAEVGLQAVFSQANLPTLGRELDGTLTVTDADGTSEIPTLRGIFVDLSLRTRVGSASGRWTARGGGLVAAAVPGDAIAFHAAGVRPDIPGEVRADLLALYDGLTVTLSVGGQPVRVSDRDGPTATLVLGRFLHAEPLPGFDWYSGRPFVVESLGEGAMVEAGDRFRLREAELLVGRVPRTVVQRGGVLRLEADVADDDADAVFTSEPLADLVLSWRASATDNATRVDDPGRDFRRVRVEGRVFVSPRPGTVPLKTFVSDERGDTMTTATIVGQEQALEAGYRYVGIQGWAYRERRNGTRVARQYWSPSRRDNLLVATREGERSADAGYDFAYDDCHVIEPAVPPAIEAPTHIPGIPSAPGVPGVPGIPAPRPALPPPVAGGRFFGAGLANRVGPITARFPLDPVRRPVKALVLSGGGAKGSFEAGAIRKLWREGYRPDLICGVSVGAVNAVKLAQGTPDAADDLVRMWQDFSASEGALYWQDFYGDLLKLAADAAGGGLKHTATWTGLASLVGRFLDPAGVMDLIGPAFVAAAATEDMDLEGRIRRLFNLAFMTHGIHSMQPLRNRLATEIERIRSDIRSHGIRLRLGITDVKSGQYFSVTEPFADSGDLVRHGFLELEPDYDAGSSWLTQLPFGADAAVMDLEHAVYASSIMPVFMEPLVVPMGELEFHDTPTGRLLEVAPRLPRGLPELIAAMTGPSGERLGRDRDGELNPAVRAAIDAYGEAYGLPANKEARTRLLRAQARRGADGKRGLGSREQVFFDGGLVDAIPIRTALRLGATEILVIGVDELGHGGQGIRQTSAIQQYKVFGDLFGGNITGGLDMMNLPAVQYALGALGGFIEGNTRNDMLMALGLADARKVGGIASDLLGRARRDELAAALRRHYEPIERARRDELAAATGLGGADLDDYGNYTNGDVTIDAIFPDRPLLGALGFDDAQGVRDGIALGELAASNPVRLL